jgi:hypothetical protein
MKLKKYIVYEICSELLFPVLSTESASNIPQNHFIRQIPA